LRQVTLCENAMNGFPFDWMSWFPSTAICRSLAPTEFALVLTLVAGAIAGWKFWLRGRGTTASNPFTPLLHQVRRRRARGIAKCPASNRAVLMHERLLAEVRGEIRKRRFFQCP
jgi:hypothetical protein